MKAVYIRTDAKDFSPEMEGSIRWRLIDGPGVWILTRGVLYDRGNRWVGSIPAWSVSIAQTREIQRQAVKKYGSPHP